MASGSLTGCSTAPTGTDLPVETVFFGGGTPTLLPAKDLVALDWTPTFTTELLRKDFDLGLAAARSLEVPMPVGASVHQLIQSAIGIGLRDKDFLSLFAQQARGAGILPVTKLA